MAVFLTLSPVAVVAFCRIFVALAIILHKSTRLFYVILLVSVVLSLCQCWFWSLPWAILGGGVVGVVG